MQHILPVSSNVHTWDEGLGHADVVVGHEVHTEQVLGVRVGVQLDTHLVDQAHDALGNIVGGSGLATEDAHAWHCL